MTFFDQAEAMVTSAFYLGRHVPSLSPLKLCRHDDGGDHRSGADSQAPQL
jgi:hypothetical protein